jgi:isoleucyl-tRNA synthetase
MTDAVTDYKSTVFLPRTSFPMRGDLPTREPALLARWAQMNLWQKLRSESAGREKFILHDGPPYANGNLHIGHALNKIHKDVINRAQQMSGRDANYIPGWDCHGLPIEWKIEEQYRKAGKNKDDVPILEFRKECRDYAAHWLEVQAEEFIRLGVAGDWQNRYATMDFESEAAIANEIGKFLLGGALYRGLRPVMWSPVEKTALAEAEIEYHDKKDTAIYVRFPSAKENATSIVIWTTTPWTIPGNRGLAVGPDIDYVPPRHASACWHPRLCRPIHRNPHHRQSPHRSRNKKTRHHRTPHPPRIQRRRPRRPNLPPPPPFPTPRLQLRRPRHGRRLRHHRCRHRHRPHGPRPW